MMIDDKVIAIVHQYHPCPSLIVCLVLTTCDVTEAIQAGHLGQEPKYSEAQCIFPFARALIEDRAPLSALRYRKYCTRIRGPLYDTKCSFSVSGRCSHHQCQWLQPMPDDVRNKNWVSSSGWYFWRDGSQRLAFPPKSWMLNVPDFQLPRGAAAAIGCWFRWWWSSSPLPSTRPQRSSWHENETHR